MRFAIQESQFTTQHSDSDSTMSQHQQHYTAQTAAHFRRKYHFDPIAPSCTPLVAASDSLGEKIQKTIASASQ